MAVRVVSVVMFRNCQPRVSFSAERTQKADTVERQQLDHAGGKDVRHVEGRRTFFGFRIPGILRRGLQDHAGRTR